MSENDETQLVWQKIEGSEKLRDIYGYYPTLHDAIITKINCRFEKREVSTTFYYSDMIGEDTNSESATLITLCWQNVVEAYFSHYDSDIYDLELKFADGKFEAVLNGAYFEERIISRNIKVSELILEPEILENTIQEFRNLKFSIE